MSARSIGREWAARLLFVACLAGSAIPASIGPALAAPAPPAENITLRVALTTSIDTLNPFTAIRLASTQVGRFMYEFLTTYSADDQTPVPGLAESWSSAPDNLTWTFRIRRGMTWSDGVPITARDAAFTYNLMLTDPDARFANGSYTENFASVDATDDHTLVIRTKRPYSSMEALDIPVVPEHVWSKVGDIGEFTNEDTSEAVVGSGPFVLTGYQPGRFVVLRANDRYWRGRPAVDEVHFVTYTDVDAAVQALRTGDVDVVNKLTPNQFQALSNQPGITVNDGHDRRFSSLLINPGAATRDGRPIGTGHPSLTDVAVRRAIAGALDLETLVQRVRRGYARAGVSVIPPVFPAYHWEPGARRRAFDPAAANRLLDAAGYPKQPDGLRLDGTGRKLTLRLLGDSANPLHTQQAQYVSQWLRELGIHVTPEYKSEEQAGADFDSGDYDLAFSSWSVTPDPDQLLAFSTCKQRPGRNGEKSPTANFFCNQTYDRLYAEQAGELDRRRRAEIVRQMQALLYEQVPEVILTYDYNLEAYRSDRFAAFQRQPSQDGVITGQNGYWWLYQARPVGGSPSDEAEAREPGWIAGIVIGSVVGLGLTGAWVARRRVAAAHRE